MYSKKITKKVNKTNNKNKKTIKGGNSLLRKAADAVQPQCDLQIEFDGRKDDAKKAYFYTEREMIKNINGSKFLKDEPEGFKYIFNKNFKNMCINVNEKYYLRFCVNLGLCINSPKTFFEVLNDVFMIDPNTTKEQSLFKRMKKNDSSLTTEKFVSEEKKKRVRALTFFLIKVVFKSIKDYETKYPMRAKSPIDSVKMKKAFIKLFLDMKLDISISTETPEQLFKKIMDNQEKIINYYKENVGKKEQFESVEDFIKNKEKKSSSFIFIVVGSLIAALLVESNIFAASHNLPGTVS